MLFAEQNGRGKRASVRILLAALESALSKFEIHVSDQNGHAMPI